MVNALKFRSDIGVLLLGAAILTTAAWLRGAEYDEQYTLFLTAGTPRPQWPATVVTAGTIAAVQSGHATLVGIARDLRVTDVHPPLYFWVVSLWREVFGTGLFAARMLSVGCGIVSLALVGVIADRCRVPRALAMLLTLGCYGFVYTNAIARGFALAEVLTLGGIALLLERRLVLAGICLGAACFCNYLAAFVAVAVILAGGAWAAVPAMLPFLSLDAWFFAAQHGSRAGQFAPFALWPSLVRLAEYQGAALFGGLPLYVTGLAHVVVKAAVGVVALAMVALVLWARPWRQRVLLAAAVAPPVGLLILGAVFNNTPIELRYLSFGLPFVALLIAWARLPHFARWLFMAVQGLGIAGLLIAPQTMQPAQATAVEAGRLAKDAVVLVPYGNDGVGIVGAFGIEAPGSMPVLLLRAGDLITDRVKGHRVVALATLAQDHDSGEAIAAARAVFTAPNWRLAAIGYNLEVYERISEED